MKLPKTRRVTPAVPLASMGDIAFLLTIFFILTSNFAKDDTRKIKPPTARELEQMEKQNVSVSIDSDGGMFFNGRPVASPATIEAGVAGVLTGRSGRAILAHLPGGDLELEWREENDRVYMTGPAVEVFTGQWPAES